MEYGSAEGLMIVLTGKRSEGRRYRKSSHFPIEYFPTMALIQCSLNGEIITIEKLTSSEMTWLSSDGSGLFFRQSMMQKQ